jgi:hypothetical protein
MHLFPSGIPNGSPPQQNSQVPGRTHKAVRVRWYNHQLGLAIKKGGWDEEEDANLRAAHVELEVATRPQSPCSFLDVHLAPW